MRLTFLSVVSVLLLSCGSSATHQALVGNWIEIMPANPEIIQGVTLNADGTASSIGMATLLYEKWKLEDNDNTLILYGKSIGNGQTIDFSDSLDIISVTTDSLMVGKYDSYRINYYKVSNVADIKPFSVVDSLRINPELGDVIERKFQGLLPAADCPGIDYTLELYNQPNSGDGVFKLTMRYLEAENGNDFTATSYGHQYTLRGDAVNKDATVYQLIPFGSGTPVNFLFIDGDLELINVNLERANSKLNYTLKLQ